MFLRFSKCPKQHRFIENGNFKNSHYEEPVRLYLKAVFIDDSLVMEYGDSIVGVAKLHEESDKFSDYDVIVAKNCVLGASRIARSIKDMICKSNKFSENPSTKRRKYYVEEYDGDKLPIKAQITFTKNK